VRIYLVRYKFLYALLAWLVYYTTGLIFFLARAPGLVTSLWGCVSLLAVFWIGTRLFRVHGESYDPRPRWKMTGHRSLSKGLGILFVAVTVIYALIFIFIPAKATSDTSALEVHIAGLIGIPLPFAILAVLYLNSSRHLRAQERSDPKVIAGKARLRANRQHDPVDDGERAWLETETSADEEADPTVQDPRVHISRTSDDLNMPYANLLPLVDALIRDGNRLRDEGFILSKGGWGCRFAHALNIDLLMDRFEIPENIRLSVEHDTILDRLTWCSITGPQS
jgi:hypothetical protein